MHKSVDELISVLLLLHLSNPGGRCLVSAASCSFSAVNNSLFCSNVSSLHNIDNTFPRHADTSHLDTGPAHSLENIEIVNSQESPI